MPIVNVIHPNNIGNGLKITGNKVIAALSRGLSFNATDEIQSDSLPVAQITRTSKISLIAAFSAAASSSSQFNNALTYAWSVTPTATLTTPNALTTTLVTPNPGEYTLTLTVTDAAGRTATTIHKLKTGRVLEVGGADEEINDRFATLQAAFDWINANDSANAASYLIQVYGLTSDSSRIVPNAARVHFCDGGQLAVGVDFGGGTFYWSGVGKAQLAINPASGAGIAFSAAATLYLQNIGVKALGTGAAQALRTGAITGCTLNLQDCYFETTNGNCVSIGGGICNIKNCFCNALAGGQAFSAGNVVLFIDGLEARAGMGYSAVYLPNVSGVVSGVRAFGSTNGATVVKVFHINMLVSDSLLLLVKDCLAVLTGATAPATIACAFMFEGTGTRQVYLVNCTAQAVLGWALVRLSTTVAASWNVINCVLIGANAGAILSSSSGASASPLPWNPARIYNTVFRGALSGPITFAAGTPQTGENIII